VVERGVEEKNAGPNAMSVVPFQNSTLQSYGFGELPPSFHKKNSAMVGKGRNTN